MHAKLMHAKLMADTRHGRYSLVKPACLYESPAARWWKLWGEGGGNPADLVVHIQHNTDLVQPVATCCHVANVG